MPAFTAYATRRDIFALGLRAEVFASRARAVESVDAATAVFRLSSHGFDDGLPLINFVVTGSASLGRPTVLLPTGLSSTVVYEPSAYQGSGNLFTVAPVDGSTITSLVNAGTGTFSVEADIGPTLDAICADESAQINNSLTGHSPPILVDPSTGRYPAILVGVTARRAALRARLVLGLSNPEYVASFAPLEAGEAADNARLEEWINGRTILPLPLDQTPGVPDDGPRFVTRRPVGWLNRCGGYGGGPGYGWGGGGYL